MKRRLTTLEAFENLAAAIRVFFHAFVEAVRAQQAFDAFERAMKKVNNESTRTDNHGGRDSAGRGGCGEAGDPTDPRLDD